MLVRGLHPSGLAQQQFEKLQLLSFQAGQRSGPEEEVLILADEPDEQRHHVSVAQPTKGQRRLQTNGFARVSCGVVEPRHDPALA